ncbi:phage virion morphogenesis protein [Sapientia aquatica]|uniref:Phage virion morphogenesis protein n=1 Tax=Sapientia aquatica TaxID=1549640 RepID=A0A4R5W2J0_9BURK|nr:phage virion morphogenesis protein [Sapientia aquatica]TDK65987.1 phage virion morphogenesis protein [Sapientia aquatica]
MIEIKIESQALTKALNTLQIGTTDLTPLMKSIGAELRSAAEENLEAESFAGSAWKDLAAATLEQRIRVGTWPGKKLQVDGSIGRGIIAQSTHSSATIGVGGVIYAAIHQLGGTAGRGRAATIPARRYLPFDADGKLPPKTESAMLALAHNYLQQLVN